MEESGFGLNGLNIYKQEGQIIQWDEIADVELKNCVQASGIENL